MTLEEYNKAIVTISKEELANLPPAEFNGEIFIVDSPEKLKKALTVLNSAHILGFDTETKPSFRKGQKYNVALIQLATPDNAYLFRTNIIGFPPELIDILQDPEILKVGLSLPDDFHNLKKVVRFEPQNFVDLQSYVKNFKIADNSLSKLFGILFNKRISKSQRLTNWEAENLSDAQKKYAALDATACVNIFEYLRSGEFDPKNSRFLTVPPDPVVPPEPTEDSDEAPIK